MTYKNAKLKRQLEFIGMWPFVFIGRIYGHLFPLKTKTSTFLFFPSADIGGAIKISADVANCLSHKKPLIIFSKKPKDNELLGLFKDFQCIDLHKKIDNKLFHFVNFFYRGVLATWINKSEKPIVFGGECLFFYKIIPHVKKETRRVENCHLDTWLHYSIGFIDLITYRVFSTNKLKQVVEEQYRENNLPEKYFNRLAFVETKINIPEYTETRNNRLEVVFIGRGAPQKRVHLIAAIAKRLHELNFPIHISFVGDVSRSIDTSQYPFCTFYGNVKDEKKMQTIWQNHDVLLLTSGYEGLPLAIMEMMAYGKVVVSTAVNSIPDYIVHKETGLLITATAEEEIVDEGVQLLQLLVNDPSLKNTIGAKARKMAIEKFSGAFFCEAFGNIFAREHNS